VIDGRRAGAARNKMQVIAPEILKACFIRRDAKERAESLDSANVTFLGSRRELYSLQ